MTHDDDLDRGLLNWRNRGWHIFSGLVDAELIDRAMSDVLKLVPSAEAYHADPVRARRRWQITERFEADGGILVEEPDFRPEQFRWEVRFPFPSCPQLNSLCFAPAMLSLARACLRTDDIRLYQATLDVRYAGDADYDQPLHLDANHSYLPWTMSEEGRYLESFVYLTEVTSANGATRILDVPPGQAQDALDFVDRWPPQPELAVKRKFPWSGPALTDAQRQAYRSQEISAEGGKGSVLAYGPQVVHRGAQPEDARSWRVLLNLSFRRADNPWVGFHTWQPDSATAAWVEMVADRTPEELEILGFPPVGHSVWTEDMVDRFALRYPGLDVSAWRAAGSKNVEPLIKARQAGS
jgi:hypothetical protein